MAKQWSKRMASSRRHKIDRKKREAKRDIRKAAKALAAAGQGRTRTKKSREIAKSALRIPKSSAQKEEVLSKLLVARQRQKDLKAKKREGTRQREAGAAGSRKRSRSVSPSRGGGDEEDGENEEGDDEEDDEGAEESDEEEEGEEQDEAEDEAGADATSDVANGRAQQAARSASSIKRLLIPTHLAGNYGEQLTRFLDSAVFTGAAPSARLPIAFLVTVDARCPVQTCPWPELDAILRRAAADPQPSAVKPLVLFALAKADLVAAQTLAVDYKILSDALADRYAALYAPDNDNSKGAPARGKGRKSQQQTATAAAVSLPVDFALCPFSPEIEGTTRQVLRVLRKYEEALRAEQTPTAPVAAPEVQGAARPSKANLPHNMFRKLAVLVLGLPKTGKSTLVSALASIGSDSSVASAQVNKLFVQSGSTEAEDAEGTTTRRVLIPSPKAITVLTLPDHPGAVNKQTALAGDVIFASEAVVDKLDAPEAVATLLLEQLAAPQLIEVAQNFSLAAPPALLERVQADWSQAEGASPSTAAEKKKISSAENGDETVVGSEKVCLSLLKSLGRVVVRDRGFVPTTYTGVLDQGSSARGAATSDPLTASTVHNAPFTASGGRRIVRVWPLKTDGRNPLKVGARTLLQEFRRSRYLPWAVLQSPTGRPLNAYDHPCVFSNRYLGKDGELVTRGEEGTSRSNNKQSAAIQNAATFLPGLQALQRALVAYIALLPRYCISIPPSAIVAPLASIPDATEQPQEHADESGESEDSEA